MFSEQNAHRFTANFFAAIASLSENSQTILKQLTKNHLTSD